MANIVLACACGKKLAVADTLRGKRVRCPHCSDAVQVPAANTPLDSPLHDSPKQSVKGQPKSTGAFDFGDPGHFHFEDHSLHGEDRGVGEDYPEEVGEGMDAVAQGLTFHSWRFQVSGWLLCGWPAASICVLIMPVAIGLILGLTMNGCAVIGSVAILVLQLLGSGFSMKVHPDTGCRGMIVAVFIIDIVGALLALIGITLLLLAGFGRSPSLATISLFVYGLGGLLLFTGIILLLLFLRKLALFMNDQATGNRCIGAMIFYILTAVFGPIFMVLTTILVARMERDPFTAAIVGTTVLVIVLLILGIAMFRISSIVDQIRRRVRSRFVAAP